MLVHETDVSQAGSDKLLQHLDRRRSLHLELELADAVIRLRVVAALPKLVLEPGGNRSQRLKFELVGAEAHQNAFTNDLAIAVAANDMLRLPDIELRKAVHREVGEQF